MKKRIIVISGVSIVIIGLVIFFVSRLFAQKPADVREYVQLDIHEVAVPEDPLALPDVIPFKQTDAPIDFSELEVPLSSEDLAELEALNKNKIHSLLESVP